MHETTIHDITFTVHFITLQIAIHYKTLHYITYKKTNIHYIRYIQKTYIHYTLHTLHTLHYILFHSIALHFRWTDGQIYVHTYAMKNIKNKNPCQKKNSQSPCEHHENIRTKSPFFHTGLNPPDLPSLADGCKAIGNVCELHTLRGGAKSWRSAGNMVL